MMIMRARYTSIQLVALFALTTLGLFLSSSNSGAHGVDGWVTESAAMLPAVNFKYSDGSPASYASVKIWSPASDSLEYQNGRTDKNGRFSFIPDIDGKWRIIMNDGVGHRAELAFDYHGSQELNQREVVQRPVAPLSRTLLAVLGCSLILNMGYAIGLLKRRYKKLVGQARGV